jgi:hypothetical protein
VQRRALRRHVFERAFEISFARRFHAAEGNLP